MVHLSLKQPRSWLLFLLLAVGPPSQTSTKTTIVVLAWTTTSSTPTSTSTSRRSTNGCSTETYNSKPISSVASISNKSNKHASSRDHVLIRSTRANDLNKIAEMLAKASPSSSSSSPSWNSWKSKLDQLWAKADIEGLLSTRHDVLLEGRKAYRRVHGLLLQSSSKSPSSYSNNHQEEETTTINEEITESDRLRALWTLNSSEKFRRTLEKASKSTGEDNVWRQHNMNVPPPNASWLRHLQLTAIATTKTGTTITAASSGSKTTENDEQQDVVVGFCEVAVMRNPCYNTYSPAILNLATAPNWRRKGVATRLLTTACRYASIHWKDNNVIDKEGVDDEQNGAQNDSLGLFVEKDNHAAMALYQKVGFAVKVTCEGGDQLGEMWYMTKDLDSRTATTAATISSITRQHEEAFTR